MAILLEDLIRSLELWLKIIKKPQAYVNPNLDPVLLVPGIGGSILNAVDDSGKQERVWVRIFGADHEFRTKLWSQFDPSTGETVSLDKSTRIVVPEDRFGLSAIDVLDPDLIIGSDCVCYFHEMIMEMLKWGFQEGKTLFGFGYDFRQSNRLPQTLDKFAAKLESVYTASGGKKVNIISHSMGGLLVKCFMSLHNDVFEKYVNSWVAIASPFRGAPGYITTCLLNGMSFVNGWEQNFFISKWSMQQLLIECPSIYELMACPNFDWQSIPSLQIWREKHDSNGKPKVMLESYTPADGISILKEALSSNKVNYHGVDMTLPLNLEILKWAHETQGVLSSAKVPSQVKFYNIYGTNYDTPHSVRYGSEQEPISNLSQILSSKATYVCVDGDGTVPAESAKADGLNAEARVGVAGDHRGIICDRHVFRILKVWLKAGDVDPFYNPLNDYVILPTAFDFETHEKEKEAKQESSLQLVDDWQIILKNDQDEEGIDGLAGKTPLVGVSMSFSCVGPKEERLSATIVAETAHATMVMQHPCNEADQNVELRALSVVSATTAN